MLIRRAALATAAATAVSLAGVALSPPATDAALTAMPRPTEGHASQVGALFTISSGGELGSHFCTASVVDSPSGDLLLTAAHCLSGRSASSIAFVPDYSSGREPYGVWKVTRTTADQDWQSSADPDDDFAFLVVASSGATTLEDLTGGEAIGIGQPAGSVVTVEGYPDADDAPISCSNITRLASPTQLQFDCDGYTDGTSGGPLLMGAAAPGSPATVIGVIGGYEQGGDTPSVSYAARFGSNMAALYSAAETEAGS